MMPGYYQLDETRNFWQVANTHLTIPCSTASENSVVKLLMVSVLTMKVHLFVSCCLMFSDDNPLMGKEGDHESQLPWSIRIATTSG